jgi:hypothetical protein
MSKRATDAALGPGNRPPGRFDPLEVARFLRPQPPLPVPPRTYQPAQPGLLARALLGDRVITRDRQG